MLYFSESLTREKEKVDTLNENILKEKVRYSQSSSSNIFETRKTMLDHFEDLRNMDYGQTLSQVTAALALMTVTVSSV